MNALRTTLMCGAALAALTLPVAAQTVTDGSDGQSRLLIITPQDGGTGAAPETAQADGAAAGAGPEATGPGVMAQADGAIVREAEPETDVASGDPAAAGGASPAAEGAASVTEQAAAPEGMSPGTATEGAEGEAMASGDAATPVDGTAAGAEQEAAEVPDPATPLGTIGDANAMAEAGASGDGLTQSNPDLAELAREADGRVIGATDGAAAMQQGMSAQQAMSILDDVGEAFYERGYRQGYMRGVQEARAQMEQALMRDRQRMMEQQAMRQPAPAEQQRMREVARQQAAQGGGLPQIIVVPQGTDMQALMRHIQMMQQGG